MIFMDFLYSYALGGAQDYHSSKFFLNKFCVRLGVAFGPDVPFLVSIFWKVCAYVEYVMSFPNYPHCKVMSKAGTNHHVFFPILMAGYLSCTWYPCKECGTNLLPWAWGRKCAFWSAIHMVGLWHAKWRELQERAGLLYGSPSNVNQSAHGQGRGAGSIFILFFLIKTLGNLRYGHLKNHVLNWI